MATLWSLVRPHPALLVQPHPRFLVRPHPGVWYGHTLEFGAATPHPIAIAWCSTLCIYIAILSCRDRFIFNMYITIKIGPAREDLDDVVLATQKMKGLE
jgi:hypothetical protein